MELSVFVNGPMLVQFAGYFGVFLGWQFEIGWSTPGIPQTRMAAWSQAGRLKPFDNMSFQLLILPRREEYWTTLFGVFFSSVKNDAHHSLKQDKEQNGFSVHYLWTEFGTEWKGELFICLNLQEYFKGWFWGDFVVLWWDRKTPSLVYSCNILTGGVWLVVHWQSGHGVFVKEIGLQKLQILGTHSDVVAAQITRSMISRWQW